jgi:hypothetical protein
VYANQRANMPTPQLKQHGTNQQNMMHAISEERSNKQPILTKTTAIK